MSLPSPLLFWFAQWCLSIDGFHPQAALITLSTRLIPDLRQGAWTTEVCCLRSDGRLGHPSLESSAQFSSNLLLPQTVVSRWAAQPIFNALIFLSQCHFHEYVWAFNVHVLGLKTWTGNPQPSFGSNFEALTTHSVWSKLNSVLERAETWELRQRLGTDHALGGGMYGCFTKGVCAVVAYYCNYLASCHRVAFKTLGIVCFDSTNWMRLRIMNLALGYD